MTKTDLLTWPRDLVVEATIIFFKHKQYCNMKVIPQYKVIGPFNYDRSMHVTKNIAKKNNRGYS